ncbi:N,N-dimethylformamidase beta subunit family domain-containing protein [Mesorhizobium sp. M0276]|uniref:N,N-dimethylformamidase beta subunit family domain-containing protein n=1 Tax=Mesorhizobium sp. M0276 TaxID=2956928 RepID=UPI003336B064
MLIGYTNRLSACAGENIEVKVSSNFSSDYAADLVRIFSADPNPNGPGMDVRPVSADFEGTYRSVAKSSRPGSYGIIPLGNADIAADATFSIRFQPRLLREPPQVLFSFIALSGGAVSISIQKDGLKLETFGETSAVSFAFEIGRWYELRLAIVARGLHLVGYSVETGSRPFEVRTRPRKGDAGFTKPVLAATPQPGDPSAFTSFFNGRLESPTLSRGAQLVERLLDSPVPDEDILAFWDFGIDIPTSHIRDRGPSRLDGALYNLPARAVRGSRWSGEEMCWRHALDEYAAVHFHEGDLYDCGWETDFCFDIPHDLPSEVYGIRLRCEDAEDIIPFFVRPARDATKAKGCSAFLDIHLSCLREPSPRQLRRCICRKAQRLACLSTPP